MLVGRVTKIFIYKNTKVILVGINRCYVQNMKKY